MRKIMLHRIAGLYTIIILCFALLLARIVQINYMEYSDVLDSQTTRTLTVGRKRGEIYDRNYEKLVSNESRLISAVTPCVASFPYIEGLMEKDELLEKLESGFPFILDTDKAINNDLIRTFDVPERYDGTGLACHVTGYLDSEGENGITGIEAAYNSLLNDVGGTLTVRFQADALGRVVAGGKKTVSDEGFSSKAGVVLTLDKDVQLIAEDALECSKIKSGCAIVMHVDTGDILAMASVPKYDRKNVAAALNDDNSPLVNKSLQSYAAGSVFKSIIAAAALENGADPEREYRCKGKITVGDCTFTCYNRKKHGKVDMTKALEESCNTYFIDLIMRIDSDYLLKLCRDIGFGESIALASTIKSSTGKLPTAEELKLKGNLANFAFGQGSLLVTPLQMTQAYHVLATGNRVSSRLVMGFTNDQGLMTPERADTPTKLLSDSTVIQLRKILSSVVEKGKADKAKSNIVSLAGKTGTAQSGIFRDGEEVCRTWFAGFFPAHNPHYIVVVMNEDGEGGNIDCGGVFKEICEGIVGCSG